MAGKLREAVAAAHLRVSILPGHPGAPSGAVPPPPSSEGRIAFAWSRVQELVRHIEGGERASLYTSAELTVAAALQELRQLCGMSAVRFVREGSSR